MEHKHVPQKLRKMGWEVQEQKACVEAPLSARMALDTGQTGKNLPSG